MNMIVSVAVVPELAVPELVEGSKGRRAAKE